MSEYWTYVPGLIPPFVFEPLLDIFKEICESGSNKKRHSCVFTNIHNKTIIPANNGDKYNEYNRVPNFDWSDSPKLLQEVCNWIEDYTKEQYDYVLVHVYTTGKAAINWHKDSEALDSSIASVSLGATRKFRLRENGKTKGWDYEYSLENGDLIWMHGPNPDKGLLSCQREFYHCVPVESTIKDPRINLTFRQYNSFN